MEEYARRNGFPRPTHLKMVFKRRSIAMERLTYSRCGDYYISNLTFTGQPDKPIGKYGRMRKRHLHDHRPAYTAA
jgi:hypothetical protein